MRSYMRSLLGGGYEEGTRWVYINRRRRWALQMQLPRLPHRIIITVGSRRLQSRYYSIMPSSDPEARNASGLTPAETKSLKERSVESHESKIIQSIKEVRLSCLILLFPLTTLAAVYVQANRGAYISRHFV